MSADGRGGNLTGPQVMALVALLAGATAEEAAQAAGRSVRSVRRWQNEDPAFGDALRAEARAAGARAMSQLLAALPDAVKVLRAGLHEGTPATRTRAAVAVLTLGREALGDDQEERLQALEERVGRWHDGKTGMNGLPPLSGR